MCKHPLKAFIIGKNEVSGKRILKRCSYNTAYVWRFKEEDTWHKQELFYLDQDGNKQLCEDNFYSYNPNVEIVRDFIEIGCGQCLQCRLDYSRQWAERLTLEALDHDESWFITLTYDNEHLPPNFGDQPDENSLHSLNPEDMTLFFKRLRENSGQQFRYYYCGEYGDRNQRPHYHLILFGFHFDDLKLYSKTKLGFELFESPFFEKTWGKGLCRIARLSYETCAYTARYVMKKQTGKGAAIYNELGILPEMVRMSRRPGIARSYFNENYESIYETDEVFIKTVKGGKKLKPPKYFDKLYEVLEPDAYDQIKANRVEHAMLLKEAKMARTTKPYLDQLETEEKNLKKRLDKLVRPLEV